MRGWRYGVPAALALAFAFIGIVAACSEDGGTITEYGLVGDGGGAIGDSSASSDGESATDSGEVANEAGTFTFDAACGNAFLAGSAIAYPSTITKTIDGVADDWGCEEPLVLNPANAQHKATQDGGFGVSCECKFEWTPTDLYVICDVSDDTPDEGTSGSLTDNDALEIYVAGTPIGSRAGNYGTLDHQLVIDWRNMVEEFSNSNSVSVAGLQSAVKARTGGYIVEAQVATTALSGSPLAEAMTLGFDLQIDNHVNQPVSLLWADSTHGPCGACTLGCCCSPTADAGDLPYCDALAFGSMTLHP